MFLILINHLRYIFNPWLNLLLSISFNYILLSSDETTPGTYFDF